MESNIRTYCYVVGTLYLQDNVQHISCDQSCDPLWWWCAESFALSYVCDLVQVTMF